jgi:serine/threonine-protein kinase
MAGEREELPSPPLQGTAREVDEPTAAWLGPDAAEEATLAPRSGEAADEPGPSSWPPLPGYEIVGELGRGGMGVVYLARQQSLDRLVALKMILAGGHASDLDLIRFRTEAAAVARLQHPNIVQVYEVGEHNGLPYFSLELCGGGSLAAKLREHPLPASQAAELVATLARAIHEAHQRGIVHRDLKPANVLLTADGTPKISDFGLAKQLDSQVGRTQTGAIVGTPSYMAPEQAEGKSRGVGPATDVYALGAILYELLTGRPPFQAETPLDTAMKVVSEEPVPPRRLRPKLARDLETICLKCLEKEGRRRYASALELAEDLRRQLDGEPILARPLGPAGRLARWARLRPALAATLVALVVFYLNHLTLLGVDAPGEGGSFHWFVTGLVLCWAAGAVAFHGLAQRPGWRSAAVYGWAAMDVLLFSAFLLRADGPKSALLVGLLILIAGAALRFRLALVWFVTGLCVLSYAGLVADTFWRRPEFRVPTKNTVLFVLSLAMMGLIMHLVLRRVRTTTSSDW